MFRRRISGVDTEVLHILRPTLRPSHRLVEIKADLPADPAVRHSQRLAHPQVREDVPRQSGGGGDLAGVEELLSAFNQSGRGSTCERCWPMAGSKVI